jgi:hypothetical protein
LLSFENYQHFFVITITINFAFQSILIISQIYAWQKLFSDVLFLAGPAMPASVFVFVVHAKLDFC